MESYTLGLGVNSQMGQLGNNTVQVQIQTAPPPHRWVLLPDLESALATGSAMLVWQLRTLKSQ